MTCTCRHGGVTPWKTLQQGDSFGFPIVYKVNDTATDIQDGFVLEVGFYDFMGNKLVVLSEGNGITHVDTGTYLLEVNHEQAIQMVGIVTVELVIHAIDESVADHTEETVALFFEPRITNN